MTQQLTCGPHNPHPWSRMRRLLVWEGKYDEYGQRREVDIAGCAMPFASAFHLRLQKIEGIDEPIAGVAQPWREVAATNQLELFEQQNPRVDDFRNRLVGGDNKLVMASLMRSFKGKVDMNNDASFNSDILFDSLTPLGFSVRTTAEYWEFIVTIKHPVMLNRLAEAQTTLSEPDKIHLSKTDPQV
jgi:hypothetical protein